MMSAVPSHSVNEAPRSFALRGGTNRAAAILKPDGPVTSVPTKTFEQKVFDALVELKVSVAQFAMHLSPSRRRTIFDQLDNIINVDDWYEDDEFPSIRAFKDVLAWSIYADVPEWNSLGVDDDGDVLLAWHSDRVTLTANFDGNRLVRWTSRYRSEDDVVGHAGGDCSLRQFAKQARFYLDSAGD